jgi:hypothetical protein
MRKEVLSAVILGLIIGLVITYGIYRARTSLRGTTDDNQITATPSPSSAIDSALILTSPADESLTDQKTSTVVGTTSANSFVVILVNEEETITSADESGNFSAEVTLTEGSNIIQVFVIDEDGKTTTRELTVVYSTQPLIAPIVEEAAPATPSASPAAKR